MKVLKKSDFNGMSCWPLREDCHWDDFCILDLADENHMNNVLAERFSKLEKSINEAIANGAKRVGIKYVNIRDQDRNMLGYIGSVVAVAYEE